MDTENVGTKMGRPRTSPALRIAQRTVLSGDCLLWTGTKHHDGYGVIGIGRSQQFRVHRVAWELVNGPIPEGLVLCHRCDTPLCVNVDHLFPGTPKENTADMFSKSREYRPTGENHPNCKISDEDVYTIKRRRENGETLLSIASDYGISFQHISALAKGKCRDKSN